MRPARGPAADQIPDRAHAISNEQSLEAIPEWVRLYGELPSIADWSPARGREGGQLWRIDRYYAGKWPSTNTVVRRFGNFTEAMKRAGVEPRPRGQHTSTGGQLPHDAREIIQQHLYTRRLTRGPAVLAVRSRGVAEARNAHDAQALRGALVDLAATALSWADVLGDAEDLPRTEPGSMSARARRSGHAVAGSSERSLARD